MCTVQLHNGEKYSIPVRRASAQSTYSMKVSASSIPPPTPLRHPESPQNPKRPPSTKATAPLSETPRIANDGFDAQQNPYRTIPCDPNPHRGCPSPESNGPPKNTHGNVQTPGLDGEMGTPHSSQWPLVQSEAVKQSGRQRLLVHT